MKLLMGISTAACMAAIIATSPASAVSLTIGGGGSLLSLGGSGDSGSGGGIGVSIGSDSGSDARVGLDADVDASLGVDVNGGDGDLLDLFGTKKLITTGGEGDNLVTVDTSDDADALIMLFGQSDGGGGAGLEVDLLDGGGTGGDLGISLFGEGQPQGGAAVAIGGGGSDDGMIVSLFGTGRSDGGGAISGGEPSEALSLFGPGAGDGGRADDIETGSVDSAPAPASGAPASGAGIGGAGGAGGAGGGKSAMLAPIPPAPDRVTASATSRAATRTTATASIEERCFSPDEQQIANLLGRSSYDASVAASWRQAAKVSIVSVSLCAGARARLAAILDADANVRFMRSAVAANAKLMAELDPSYDPENVLAVDQAGENVTVYVY